MDSEELVRWYPEICKECLVLKKKVSETQALATISSKSKKAGNSVSSEASNAARSANLAYERHQREFHETLDPPVKQVREYLSQSKLIE